MRRTKNNKLKEYLKIFAKQYTIDELLPKVNKIFDENFTRYELQKYLLRHKIKYKYKSENMARNARMMGTPKHSKPIGTEYTNYNGLVLVKVDKNKWVYKGRLIYENYYGVKLKEDEMIIFLDGNRKNFNIDNLKLITKQEAGYLGTFRLNDGIDIKDKNVIETEIAIAKTIIKSKELEKDYEKNENLDN